MEPSILDVIYLVLGTGLFFLAAAYVRFCERLWGDMAEAFIGLLVALGLGVYLVHALLHPEKY